MGRKSSAALSVATPVKIDQRPLPPGELTADQTEIWIDVVNRMPADWFPAETHPILIQYCRHVCAAKRVAHLIDLCEREKKFDLAKYDFLLKMQDRESKVMSTVATKMRLTQQASYTTQASGTAKRKSGPKPWVIDAA